MRQIETELETLQESVVSTDSDLISDVDILPSIKNKNLYPSVDISAVNLDLLSKELTTTTKSAQNIIPLNIITDNNSSKVLLVEQNKINGLSIASWSEFRPWNECFCGRQVRTRICKYDSHSSGN